MKKIADGETLNRILSRLAHEIAERNRGAENIAVVGVRKRGVQVAKLICDKLEEIEGIRPDMGVLDVTLYRDDLIGLKKGAPLGTIIDFSLADRSVILCDDVLFTGRTVRAAISAILDIGRPKRIQLLSIVDRGHRELPIRADYIGKNIPTSLREKVFVRFRETDGFDGIYLLKEGEELDKLC